MACVAFYYAGTDAFGGLEARLREVYGAPDDTSSPGAVTYRNRITGLALERWGPNTVARWQEDDEPYVKLRLSDARWPFLCS